ncbi:11931_t:CDS:2, partial [Racocetra persica]
LGFEPTEKEAFINAEIKELQIKASNYTYLVLKPKTLYKKEQTLTTLLEIETAKHHVSKARILFANNPYELNELRTDATINDRVLVLESVLRKYYLDTDFFAELNYIVQKNKKFIENKELRRIDEKLV